MKNTTASLLCAFIIIALCFTGVFAYDTPFDVPKPASADTAVNTASDVNYHLTGDGTYIYCNNPESLHDADVGKALIIEHDIHGDVFFTNENICRVKGGVFLGLQVRNNSSEPITVTVHNIGYQACYERLGQQEWSDFFQNTYNIEKGGNWEYHYDDTVPHKAFTEQTYTIPAGKYFYVMGGTTGDAYGSINVAGSANQLVKEDYLSNGVVFFTVDGPEKGVDAAFVCCKTASTPVKADVQQGYVVKRDGNSYGRQYNGSAPFLYAEASLAWNIDDSFADGKRLPVKYDTVYCPNEKNYGAYEEYGSFVTKKVSSDKWRTNLNPQSDSNDSVGNDMMPFYCVTEDGREVVIDVRHNDGDAIHANIGNWMTVYEESLTFKNSGSRVRSFDYGIDIKGIAAINVRDSRGELLYSVFHYESGHVYTVNVYPGETETITVEYVLLANSYGNVVHYVTAGTPTSLHKTLRDALDKNRLTFGNGYAVGFEAGSVLSAYKTTSDKVVCVGKNGKETDGNIGTGTELRLCGASGDVVDKAIAVVKGDVDGDGDITVTDYIMIRRHLLGYETLEDAYLKASDADENGKTEMQDYITVRLTLLK